MNVADIDIVGSFGKPHGVKGEIVVSLDVDDLQLSAGDFIFASIDGLDVPFRILAVRAKGSDYLLTLKGIDSEKSAALLANKPLLAKFDSKALHDSDEVYLEDLVGFNIFDSGVNVGVIKDYSEPTPENPLFLVDTPLGQQFFVPASGDLINEINFDNKTIDMDLPQGLIDLNSSK